MIRYNPKGLSSQEAADSRRTHGDNVITPPKDDSAWKLFVEKFKDPIIRILLLAAVLSLAIGSVHKDFTESIGIICAIILATCVGFWFEWDAMRRFRRLNQVNDDIPVKVMRDGSIREIPRRDVVVGDVVYIESGETVPADGELVEAVSLRINESTLTGELEVDKTVDEAHFDSEATYPSNVALRGTTVADGYGVLVATAVGDATEAGRVTEQATVQSDEQTPLNRQLTRLSKLIGRAGIALAVAIFCVMLGKAVFVGGLFERDWLEISQQVLHIFMVSVAIIVMAVPEGLPMSITLSLAMSMRRMLKTNNLVRRMHACETMGAVTVICTDKTGTLTQNRMHVQELVRYDALPAHDFAEIVAANSTAFLDASGAVIGNPTEGALLEWMRSQGEDYEPLRSEAKIVDRLTFSTERKYMATIIESGVSGRRIVCVKGAPEIVRAMCAPDGKDTQVAEQLAGFQGRAMRTLAVAWAETAEDDCLRAVAASQLHFSGVAAISDPVREDVPDAVRRCLNAGIDVKIVTGDTPATAREIARQIGLWDDARDNDRNYMTGTEFAAIVICFVGAVFGTDMPLTVVQILWVNIIMDTFAAMAMASLPPNPEVMLEKPRPRDEFIITPGMARTLFICGGIMVAVLLGMLFWWTITAGGLTVRQLTLFFSTFVFLQFWNMFNAKGFETRHSVFTCLRGCREFFLILLAIAAGQVLIVEFGGEVFRTEPLAWREWAAVIGCTSLLAIGGEAIRALRRKR